MQAFTLSDLKNQLNRLLYMATKGLVDDEYKEKSEKIKSVRAKLQQANLDVEEKTKNWYEVVGKNLEVLKNPNEQFDSTTCSGEKRSILQSIGYDRTYR